MAGGYFLRQLWAAWDSLGLTGIARGGGVNWQWCWLREKMTGWVGIYPVIIIHQNNCKVVLIFGV